MQRTLLLRVEFGNGVERVLARLVAPDILLEVGNLLLYAQLLL